MLWAESRREEPTSKPDNCRPLPIGEYAEDEGNGKRSGGGQFAGMRDVAGMK